MRPGSYWIFYDESPLCGVSRMRKASRSFVYDQFRHDFRAYLDDVSQNIQDLLDSFKFRKQMPTLFPRKDCGRDPYRHLEIRRFPCRADPDHEIRKTAIAQSIRTSNEQDPNLSDLRRRREEQIGGRRRPLKDGMVISQRQ